MLSKLHIANAPSNYDPDKFEELFNSWMAGCQKMLDKEYNHPVHGNPTLVASQGQRFIKVNVKEHDRISRVYAFIDKGTGDVLKPASFKTPAKGPRGNIFDAHNGLARMSAYGPGYNR
ncbi:MAG: hypothetical protein HQK56_16270 [Deltaproteobacteria bacterium]|nr:hypothetical protein [Deltaproteobacteria bacterium]